MSDLRFPQFVVRFVEGYPVVTSARRLPLAFVHINKTAGTTFSQYLNDHFASPDVIAPPYMGDIADVDVEDRSRELFWGHFTYAQFCERKRDAWFITFLRDPVERVISQYRSLHNPKNLQPPWDSILSPEARRSLEFAQKASLDEFVNTDDEFLREHIWDLQTAFLSSFTDRSHPMFLASALQNLERRFLFFGITEQFDQSVRLFQYQLLSGLEYEPQLHRQNVSPPCPIVLRPSTLKRIEALVENDQVVYERAQELLRQRLYWVGQAQQEQRWQKAA